MMIKKKRKKECEVAKKAIPRNCKDQDPWLSQRISIHSIIIPGNSQARNTCQQQLLQGKIRMRKNRLQLKAAGLSLLRLGSMIVEKRRDLNRISRGSARENENSDEIFMPLRVCVFPFRGMHPLLRMILRSVLPYTFAA